MAVVIPTTIGQSLYWSYANLAMTCSFCSHDKPTLQTLDYMIRNKTYYGLLNGRLQLGSFLIDEKLKICLADLCQYCGDCENLSLDHLIPQFKNGDHSANNLIVACQSCNSSKGSLDFLEWMAKKGAFPDIGILRRYLKLAIGYCVQHDLMNIPLRTDLFYDVDEILAALPFAITLLPHEYPIHDIYAFYYDDDDEEATNGNNLDTVVPVDAENSWESPSGPR